MAPETVGLILPDVLAQHLEEAAFLAGSRALLTTAPLTLRQLSRFDDRLMAHLDALSLGGLEASKLSDSALDLSSRGSVFVATVRILEEGDKGRLERLLSAVRDRDEGYAGLISALGWMSPEYLRGIVTALRESADPFERQTAIAVCGMHRVDPGVSTRGWNRDPNPRLRQNALRTAGELGLIDVLSDCAAAAVTDDDVVCRFWAAWAATLLGNREGAVATLSALATTPGSNRTRAFDLYLQAISRGAGHSVLQGLRDDSQSIRWLLRGSGIVGDVSYVPWLIAQMGSTNCARPAGEAFSLITGVNLLDASLEAIRPADFESGPNDDPDDPDVGMDPDDGLPWPDGEKIQKWWVANSYRFHKGIRYFMGQPVSKEHCIHVLKTGYQRQRILAAHYLCLLEPGTPLFNTSAPAWRQQRLLANM